MSLNKPPKQPQLTVIPRISVVIITKIKKHVKMKRDLSTKLMYNPNRRHNPRNNSTTGKSIEKYDIKNEGNISNLLTAISNPFISMSFVRPDTINTQTSK